MKYLPVGFTDKSKKGLYKWSAFLKEKEKYKLFQKEIQVYTKQLELIGQRLFHGEDKGNDRQCNKPVTHRGSLARQCRK